MLLSLLVLLALIPGTLVVARADCLARADHKSINKLFSAGGAGTKVYLCPGTEYPLSGTIVFTAADQELATVGYPSGAERATLVVRNELLVTAVQGDCRRCARVGIRSLVIDGGRSRLGRSQDPAAAALVVLGGNEGQSVVGCALRHPRGWAAVHVREGSKLQCSGAVVENNEIGPAGDEYDPATDGPDPEMSPLGRPLADGIAIACRDSTVRQNTIVDCTDAGIVVYCSPGSVIDSNTIATSTRSGMAGILMVDAGPFDGDYTGTIVRDNILDAAGSAMRVGVGVGPAILSDDIETVLSGGSVINNNVRGQFMGFGFAASGLKGWTILDNWSDARHAGKKSARCFDEPVNPEPTSFLYHNATITDSDLQDEFVDSDFAYIVCIDGLDAVEVDATSTSEPEPELESGPELEAEAHVDEEPEAEEEEEEQGISTGSEALDSILLHSQQSMLRAIEKTGRRVEDAIVAAQQLSGYDEDLAVRGKTPLASPYDLDNTQLSDLDVRLDELERTHKGLLARARKLSTQLRQLSRSMQETHTWQSDVLLHMQQVFYDPAPAVPVTHDAPVQAGNGVSVFALVLGGSALAGVGYRLYVARKKRLPHAKAV